MRSPTRSYLKVAYDLRLAKQVERRIFLDALQRLAEGGFEIREYQYTGFGSFYFVDFIIFRRFLGMRRLLSVEYSAEIQKRVLFNRPFGDVEVDFRAISEVIPGLSWDRKHLLWLDYDDVLHEEMLEDVMTAASQLSLGSVLLVTVDVEPPVRGENVGPTEWKEYFEGEARSFLDPGLSRSDFSRSMLGRRNTELLNAAINAGLAGRQEVAFKPLFNFLYQDGHLMSTLGGMIATEAEERRLSGVNWSGASYLRRDLGDDPYRIRIPRLTRKERLLLDSQMPCPEGWSPTEFELSGEDVAAYREIYRFYPSFVELLLG